MRMSVREFAEQLGISHRNVSKWEAGGADVFPRPGTQEILDDALANATREVQIRFELNLGLARAESARAGAAKVPAENGEQDTETPWVESRQVRPVDPVDRKDGFPARQSKSKTTTSELDTVPCEFFDEQQIELLRQSLHEAVSENALSDASIDDWEQTALRHGTSSRDRPSGLFVADLRADLAELTRDGYYYSGDFRGAIDVACHAQEIAWNIPSVGAAQAAALEARTLATLGLDEAMHAALHRAESIRSRLDDSALVASAFGYSEAQFRFHEGSALTRLGDVKFAWKAHDRALELPSTDYTDRAMTRLDRAECLLRDHDLSDALDYARRTLEDLNAGQRRGIISTRAREIADALPANCQKLPAAREFHELLRSFAEARE
jgi:transcriptional regulator with XRE-family HTH domain